MRARRFACCSKASVDVASSGPMQLPREWAQMGADQLSALATALIGQLAEPDARISDRDAELSARDAQLSRDDNAQNRSPKHSDNG